MATPKNAPYKLAQRAPAYSERYVFVSGRKSAKALRQGKLFKSGRRATVGYR